ncbi:mannose-6-phosphate isomerase, class I [Frigoribacterium sp. PhB24]|uniref:mannose-6-phosphate isomerase, class I n=1 Tax=Frigoribacterium sp. PhB24 TaxID=2485204 RepID=UPI000F48D584|nr:mannose-6-phosphate isomerase, class I [Frigoribacterium sp. PhB24]ROS53045.1 mannose-6-phosphate isomerase type 1 [Frigoribacterium sp. PhB24]
MFLAITNTPRDYAWGSTTAIADLLGRRPSGRPEAELWLGAHPGSPSVVVAPAVVGGADTLADWFAAEPSRALGRDRDHLPFLLKLLAADGPLSIQAHPTPEQAREGFAREDDAGIPIDAPERNYKDASAKPEIIVALSDTFDALCGFREAAETLADVDLLDDGSGRLDGLRAHLAESLRSTLAFLFRADDESAATIAAVSELAAAHRSDGAGIATVVDLAERYPGDPGVVLSLLLNRVTLRAGEALFLPAGNVHAYLGGFGVELMAPSDNVLRGGLTPKHVDVPELLKVLDFEPLPVPRLEPTTVARGVERFAPVGTGFALLRVDAAGSGAVVEIGGPSIVLVTDGEVHVKGQDGTIRLGRGESAFVTPDEVRLAMTGGGTAYVATPA